MRSRLIILVFIFFQYVQEVYSFFGVEFSIQDANLGIIYQIEGPKSLTRCLPKETHFRVFSMGGHREQVGSITRSWNADNASYSTNIYFNDPNLDVKRKSFFVGAAFLLVRWVSEGNSYVMLIRVVYTFYPGVHVLPRPKLLLLTKPSRPNSNPPRQYETPCYIKYPVLKYFRSSNIKVHRHSIGIMVA